MRYVLTTILSLLLLLTSPLFGQSYKGEVLYRWDTSSGFVWEGFGDSEIHPQYQGYIENRKPNGLGILIFPNGDKYVGEFKDGIRNGQGTYTFSNGGKYVGEFKEGLPNGQGTFTFPSGDKYVGEFKDGLYDGQGTVTYSTGRKYVGEYKDGKRINGTEFDKTGNIIGKWVMGEWSETIMNP